MSVNISLFKLILTVESLEDDGPTGVDLVGGYLSTPRWLTV